MKTKNFILTAFLFVFVVTLYAQEKVQPNWVDFEKTINATDNSKFTMVYVYQEKCSLCPATEALFSDTAVVAALKKNFTATKFDARTKKEIQFNGMMCPYNEMDGGDGMNIATILLLDGKMGFPSCVFFNKKNEKLGIHYAPKDKKEFLTILNYYSSKAYETQPSFEEWMKTQK